MRILLVGVGYRGYMPYYERALTGLGHEVIVYTGTRQYDVITRLHRVARVRAPALFGIERDYSWSEQQRFLAWYRRTRPVVDFALFVNSDRLLTDDILREIADAGIPSGIWLLDDIPDLADRRLDFGLFSRHASFSEVQAPILSSVWGRDFVYVPQGFAPIPFSAAAMPSESALVLGNAYPSRRTAADALNKAGYRVDVVGRTWRTHLTPSSDIRIHKDVTLAQSLAMSSGARLCGNGHRDRDAGVGPRVFEIAAAGGVLIDDNPRSPDFFEPGKEMLTWTRGDDVVEHALRLRREPALAARVATAAQRRVHAEHSIQRRFADLLSAWGM